MAIPSGTNDGLRKTEPLSKAGSHRRAVARVHRQHVDIIQHLRELSERLEPLDGPAHPGDLRNDVSGRLARLQSELAEHFAEEERVGFVPRATAREPRLTRRARNILSQHDLLRIELSKVVSGLSRGSADWGQVREGFGFFTELLRQHERQENELINEAYLDDLGGLG